MGRLQNSGFAVKKYLFSAFTSFSIIILLLLLLFISSSPFHKTFAASPAFELQALSDQRNDWVQTYGNDGSHLKSDYANILETDYLSDGKTLKATFWLAPNLENASTYNQPFKRISYGMLIDLASKNINTGYNGADYDYYIEAVNGKWSEYLYQLSSTGAYVLIDSKINYSQPVGGPTIGPGYVKLRLNLSSIDYPSEYGILFYTAESFKSNEVRDFTSWVAIPPSTMKILTSPNDIVIRQGEQQLIPADIFSIFSNNVTSITFNKNNNNVSSDFNSNGLHVSIQRIQPPLFNVEVPSQTPIGIYTVPFTASVLIQTTVTSTKPIFNHTVSGFVDPEFQSSKKYPTIGYITNPLMNLTITVIPPLTINDKFKDFWSIYGQPISIVLGGFAGGFASLVFGRIRSRTT
ncbi:MAG: hypothetical protein WBQ16_02880 [Nitrososphaeraceae archaeon]